MRTAFFTALTSDSETEGKVVKLPSVKKEARQASCFVDFDEGKSAAEAVADAIARKNGYRVTRLEEVSADNFEADFDASTYWSGGEVPVSVAFTLHRVA